LKLWLNGELVEDADACIGPRDRGFLLGDGVFETLRTYTGRPFALRKHLERLITGAGVLGIPLPPTEKLEEGTRSLLEASELPDARLRITVTGGAGPPGLARGEGPATVLITASSVRRWSESSSAIVCPWAHDERSPLAGVKTTSRADSVLALVHARSRGAEEGLFLNGRGELCEATTANVFVVRDGRVETPPISSGCLAGITREHVLRLCGELEIEAGECDIPANALGDADELFLTSSTREVQPLVRVDGKPVAEGTAGPVTRRLADAFSRMVAREIQPQR
jgi:branched-chain amino acid aminotransferase